MDSARRSHIRKGPVTVVMVKNAFLEAGDKDVLVTVTVIVPDRHSHGEDVGRDSGLLRNVRESSVTIVAIESMVMRSLRVVEDRVAGVHQQQVHATVSVVIKDGNAGRLGLRLGHHPLAQRAVSRGRPPRVGDLALFVYMRRLRSNCRCDVSAAAE